MRISDWSSDVCSSDLQFLMESSGGGPDGLERIHRLERQQRALLSLAQARTPHGLLEGLAAAAVGLAVRLIELWARRTALSSSKVSDDHIERRGSGLGSGRGRGGK